MQLWKRQELFRVTEREKKSAALNAQALWRELSGIAKGISLDAREGSEQTRPDVSTASRLPQIFPVSLFCFSFVNVTAIHTALQKPHGADVS